MKLLCCLSVFALGVVLAQSPFPDVAPCHWSVASLERIASPTPATQAQTSDYLVANAVRQVFEGLRCGDPSWSARFVQDAPATFTQSAIPTLNGFTLSDVVTNRAAESATVAFTISATIDGQTLTRQGQAQVFFTGQGWQVAYASLAGLELPIFP